MKLNELLNPNGNTCLEGSIEIIAFDSDEAETVLYEGYYENMQRDAIPDQAWPLGIDYLVVRQDGVMRIELEVCDAL